MSRKVKSPSEETGKIVDLTQDKVATQKIRAKLVKKLMKTVTNLKK